MVTETDRSPMARDASHDLIASDRVEGTTV
jgi:hypothetical protein